MAVGSSFDQWRKDVFFSAAEEVQESADRLESVYRTSIRCNRDGFEAEISDGLLRELHTALGTAKWQLDEFERAVNLSHENCSAEENKITRHNEFVAAIGNQISQIEKAMNDSLVEEGKQPLRWVQLDEEERDALAIFLSGAPQTSQETKGNYADHDMGRGQVRTFPDSIRGFKETVTINKDSKYVVKVAAKEPFRSKVDVIAQEGQLDGHKRTWSSLDISAWKIEIADEEVADRKMAEMTSEIPNRGFPRGVEFAAKSKWLRNNFRKAKSGEHLQLRQGLSNYLESKGNTWFTQGINGLSEKSRSCFSSCNEDPKVSNVQRLLGRAGGFRRHVRGPPTYIQIGRSLRVTIFLLLTIFLIVPFLLYST